jgi:hypothetical protein
MLSEQGVVSSPCWWSVCLAAGPHCHIACATCHAPAFWNLACATCREAWIHEQVPPAGVHAPDTMQRVVPMSLRDR